MITRVITRRSQKMFVAVAKHGPAQRPHRGDLQRLPWSGRSGHRAAAREKFAVLNDDVFHAAFGAQVLLRIGRPGNDVRRQPGLRRVAVVGGLHVAAGQITLGAIQAFIQYVRQFNQPLTQIAGMYNTLQSGWPAERVSSSSTNPNSRPSLHVSWPSGRASRVEFDDVTFRYVPGSPVLEHLSLIAEPGQTVAIIGRPAPGKDHAGQPSDAVLRADAGRILIDGMDTTTVSRHSLRTQIGMVPSRTPWLFTGTIARTSPTAVPAPATTTCSGGGRRTSTGSSRRCPTDTTRWSATTVAR